MSFVAQLEVNSSGFSRGIDQAEQQINQLQKAVEKNLDKIGRSFDSIGRKMSIFSAAFGLAASKSFMMAADFQDALGATDQVFKQSSEAAKAWAESLPSQFGIAKKEALEYQNLMGTMLKNIGGLSEDMAQKQASSLIELAGDLTAMYGGRVQDAVRALTGSLKGNNTMLDNYGMAVNDSIIKNRALELGLIKTGEELSLQAKQAATLSLIWEQTAAAQGQAAREADGASGTMRSFRVEVQNLATEFGEVLLPAITPFISKIREVVSMLRNLSPEMQTVIIGVSGIAAAIGPALIALSKLIALSQSIGMLKIAFAALTGPIGIAVAAIAGAAILIIKNWDAIKEYFTSGPGAELFNLLKSIGTDIKNEFVGAWNIIKDITTRVWDAIGSDVILVVNTLVRDITTSLTVVVQTFRNVATILEGIFTLDLKMALEGLKNLFGDIFRGIADIVIRNVATMAQHLSTFFKWIGLDKWSNSLGEFSKSLSSSMSEATEVTKQASEEQAKAADKVKDKLDDLNKEQKFVFKDGSDVYELVRRTSDEITVLTNRLEGLRSGTIEVKNVHQEISKVEQRVKDLKAALDTLTNNQALTLNLSGDRVAEAWRSTSMFKDMKPVITPQIDVSLVKEGMGKINDELMVFTMDMGSLLGAGITDMMNSVGRAISDGGSFINSIGAALLGSVGKMAQQLGAQMIAFGTAGIALKKLMLNPYLSIAAGAALVALGSAASAVAGRIVNSGGSSGYSGGTSSYTSVGSQLGTSDYRGMYRDDWSKEVVFKIGNNELIGVLEQANKRNNRLG